MSSVLSYELGGFETGVKLLIMVSDDKYILTPTFLDSSYYFEPRK